MAKTLSRNRNPCLKPNAKAQESHETSQAQGFSKLRVPSADFAHHRVGVARLNHGSFGSPPAPVLEKAQEYRSEWLAQPDEWYYADRLEDGLRSSTAAVAKLMNSEAEQVVLVENATVAACIVAQRWGRLVLAAASKPHADCASDEHGHPRRPKVMMFNFAYEAVVNVVRHYCCDVGADLVLVDIPFPISHSKEVLDAIQRCIDRHQPEYALLDMVTSQPAITIPIIDVVKLCQSSGMEVAVDAAHALGNVEVDVEAIGADFLFTNLHKWAFAPSGVCALQFQGDTEKVEQLHHPIVSWHWREGLKAESMWTGTRDYSAMLAVPRSLAYHAEAGGGGAHGHLHLMQFNHSQVLRFAYMLGEAWGTIEKDGALPVPPSMCSSMAMVRLPEALKADSPEAVAALRSRLREVFKVEAALICLNKQCYVRLSHQIYNCKADYVRLQEAVKRMAKGKDLVEQEQRVVEQEQSQ
ncbi:hypothetical protein CYMTET_8571 [Cymbomonas tetramitiformis]|uniref:Aminotransferase class V domain-containing protein n=1 Tax=Cymbomonas tetramitiformis TaxID=36881 RepID=A0AAE0GTH7_9CHLO|nr:hypothetical protein CYMTET_8571 [Cymbomonas tetramitiformis]